jgi:subtilisin family serine protease
VFSRPAPRHGRRRTSLAAGLALAALLGGAGLASAPTASAAALPAAAAADPQLQPAGDDRGVAASSPVLPSADYEDGRYVVVLRDDAAGRYSGGVSGLKATASSSRAFSATSTRTQKYVSYLRATQKDVAASVGATRLATYTLTTNGFAAELTATQAAKLAADPRVSAVVENEILQVADATTSTGYLGLEGDGGVWDSVGGVAKAGDGIVIGVVDTGIAPENPSFAGDELASADSEQPYRDGNTIVFHKSDGSDFTGVCTTGVQFTAADCSTKIVGARYFVDGFGADYIGDPSTGEYLSPRDGASHGSHTASTAAGDADVATGAARISGVTPAAKIAAYKACWDGPTPDSSDDDGCATIDLLSAIDAAVGDNVDVINYSIGGGSAETTNSLTDQAFMSAASAGIFVAASAGNAGPDASTLDNASPWITTVAASTIPAPEATVELGNDTTALGASVTVPEGGVTGPLVNAEDVALGGADDAQLCMAGALDPALAAGKIVLCDRGTNDRVAKSAEVARVGGIGMVLVNPTPDSTDLDAHSVPTVHVDAQFGDALHAYADEVGATATLVAGNTSDQPSIPTPQVAGFSSRGPVEADGSDLIKPDISAPGVNILAAEANAQDEEGVWGYMSGTSMASPHIAGLAALYLSTKADASPAEIKSALMTTAVDTVDADGAPASDPFAQGNGQVTPRSFLEPGLVYLNDVDDWNGYLASIDEASGVDPIDGSDLNLASMGIGSLAGTQTVTRTVTATAAGDFTASVAGMPGVDVQVEPASLHFDAAGEQHTFTVEFTRTDAPLGDFSTGYLTWSGDDTDVRSSLAVRPVAFDAPAEVAGTGIDGSVDLVAHVGDEAVVDLTADGLARGSRATGTGTASGDAHRYAVRVPEGASFLRFDLDAADDSADLDLTVYSKNANNGQVSLVGQSATGSADERVDVGYVPESGGTYIVDIDFYAEGTGGPELDYTLTSYVVQPDAELGDLTLDPSTIDGEVGDAPTVTASWTGLEPGAYLGLVRFGDTGITTIVSVDAGEETPVESGDPMLEPLAEWTGQGEDLEVHAAGLTPGATYTAAVDGTTLRTGGATTRGTIDWALTIVDDVEAGEHEFTLTGDDAELSDTFQVSPITIRSGYAFPSTGFDGVAKARIETEYSGHGDLRFHLESAATGKVYLDEVQHVGEIVGVDTWSASSSTVVIDAGTVDGTITVVLPDGSDGPTYAIDPFEAETSEPGTITFSPHADDADLVDVDFVNPTYWSFSPTVRYYGADGRQVFASGYIAGGETGETWDLTGFTRVDVIDDGTLLASYQNTGPGMTDVAGIRIAQDYSAMFTAGPDAGSGEPITMEVRHRYAPYSGGFDLSIGEGDQQFSQDPFYYESIPTEVIEERGPIVSRSVTVKEGVGHWAVSYYEQQLPIGIHTSAMAFIEAPALTVDDLTPDVETPPDAGTDPEPVPALVPGTPSIAGGTKIGATLVADPGSWSPASVTLAYQWLRDGTAITGATGTRYILTKKDAGHDIQVRVLGTRGADQVSATSAAITAKRILTATPKPKLTGKAKVGKKLRVTHLAWKPADVRLTFRWLRDGDPIAHATKPTYTLKKKDRRDKITVVVTGHMDGYMTKSRESAARKVR